MKIKFVAVLLGVLIISGCYGSASLHLYPVKGPLALQTPLPVFSGKISGNNTEGDITLALSDGETAQGHWTKVTTVSSADGKTTSLPVTEGMPAAWEAVYGPGFYSAHVLGRWLHGSATVTSDKGTALQVEFVSGESEAPAKGVAKDNKDNVYKVVFY